MNKDWTLKMSKKSLIKRHELVSGRSEEVGSLTLKGVKAGLRRLSVPSGDRQMLLVYAGWCSVRPVVRLFRQERKVKHEYP
jgi:hypothetical protein